MAHYGDSCVPSWDITTTYRLELIREEAPPSQVLDRPERAEQFLHKLLARCDREVFGVIYLDTRNRPTGHAIAYIGTTTRAAVEARGVFVPALLSNAAGVILFHNHPSGDPTPSRKDWELTERMIEVGQLLDIPVVDHIIVGIEPSFSSFRKGW